MERRPLLITTLNKLLPRNSFARSVSLLAGGTASAQILMVLASPLLTRLYSPEDFGVLAVYSGLLGLFIVISSFRYELVIPLPETESNAENVLILSLLALIVTSIILLIVVTFVGKEMVGLLGVPKLGEYLWLLPLGAFLGGLYNILHYWGLRTKHFSLIAKTRVSQAITNVLIQVCGYKLGAISLMLGQASSQGVGCLSLSKLALHKLKLKRWSWRGVFNSAIRYKNFPIFSTWSALFNSAGQQLPTLMFAAFFGASAAGIYMLAHRVLITPISILGSSIGGVFLSNAAEARRSNDLGKLVIKVFDKLAWIAMPGLIIITLYGPELFSIIFGTEWLNAGEFARWMAPWLFMAFITSPLSSLIEVMEKQRLGMVFQAIFLIVRLLVIIFGSVNQDLLSTVVVFSAVSTLFLLLFLYWVIQVTDNSIKFVFITVIKTMIVSLCITSPLLFAKFFLLSNSSFFIAFAITGGGILYYYYKIFQKGYRKSI